MAKRKKNDAATIKPGDRVAEDAFALPADTPHGEILPNVFGATGITDEPPPPAAFRLVDLVIPLADEAPGYQPLTVDLRLKRDEAIVVRQLLEGLAGTGAKLANGQPPKKYEDGLRILIRMLGSAIASPVDLPHDSPASFQGG